VLSAVMLAGPLLLSLMRIALADDTDELRQTLVVIPKALAVGAIATVSYALPALACSAVSRKRWHGLAMWAAFYMLIGTMAAGISIASETPALGAVDLKTSVVTLAYRIFDVEPIRDFAMPPVWSCAAALGTYVVASMGFLYLRVAQAERSGMGGG
jgi:hypothetical protein